MGTGTGSIVMKKILMGGLNDRTLMVDGKQRQYPSGRKANRDMEAEINK